MSGSVVIAVLLAVAALAVAISLLLVGRKLKRTVAEERSLLAGWASQHGWQLGTDLEPALRPALTQSPGGAKKMRYHRYPLSGQYRNLPVTAFEYFTMDAHGHHDGHQVQSASFQVTMVPLPTRTPALAVQSMHVSGLQSPNGTAAVHTGDPVFDGTYRIAAADSAFAHAVLTPQLRHRLVAEAGRRALRIDFDEGRLVLAEPRTFDPQQIFASVDLLAELVAFIPHQVWGPGGRAPRR